MNVDGPAQATTRACGDQEKVIRLVISQPWQTHLHRAWVHFKILTYVFTFVPITDVHFRVITLEILIHKSRNVKAVMCESLKCLPLCWWCVLQVRVICITGFLLCCNIPTDLRIHVLLPSLDVPFCHIVRARQDSYVAVLVAEVVLDAVDVQMVPLAPTLIKVSGWRDDLGEVGQRQCEDDLTFACVCPYQVIGRMHRVLEPPQLLGVRPAQLCAVGSGVQITRLFPAILDRTAAGFFRFAESEVHITRCRLKGQPRTVLGQFGNSRLHAPYR